MLQNLTRSAIVMPAPTRAPAIKPLPLEPGEPDLNEMSLDNLAALADAAYKAGDRASAEVFVRRLYAQYDRQQGIEASGSDSTTAAWQRGGGVRREAA
jgi:hypothetical protein